MLLGADRSKLSKRHGAVAVTEYRDQGYLPEAMVNFLALLGWSLDDKTEILSREELVANFTLDRISQTAAIFNPEKLGWMDGVYIRRLEPADFVLRSLPFLERDLPAEVARPLDIDYVRRVLPLVQERARTLSEVAELTRFFFVTETMNDPALLIAKEMDRASTLKTLKVSLERLGSLPAFDEESLETVLRPLAEELALKTGQLFGTLRVAVTGRTAAPPLFQTMAVLGKALCLSRIETALTKLS
jgi:glutamyl-tRNA synthetase